MFCKKCGKNIPDNVKYCPFCGCNQTTKWVVEIPKPNISLHKLSDKTVLRRVLRQFFRNLWCVIKGIFSFLIKAAVCGIIGSLIYLIIAESHFYYNHKDYPEATLADFNDDDVGEFDTIIVSKEDYDNFKVPHSILFTMSPHPDTIFINDKTYYQTIRATVYSLPREKYGDIDFSDGITFRDLCKGDTINVTEKRDQAIRKRGYDIAEAVSWTIGILLLLTYYIRKFVKWLLVDDKG